MSDNLVWPLLSVILSGFGAWAGVRVALARLEVTVNRAIKDIEKNAARIAQHNEDLTAHDVEIDQLLAKNGLRRVRRQPLRGWGNDGD